MPHRLNELRAKVQFVTWIEMPSLIRKAANATGEPSSTTYIQRALCRALARDLGLDYETLLSKQPPPRGPASTLFGRSLREGETKESAQNGL